jgi:DNA-binding MarR family transcriptional regulator
MGPQTIVIDLVRKIQLVLRRVCDADLHPHGLSFSQFAVLRAVAEHPGGSLSALARSSGMSKQAVHQMLGGLRAASLVTAAERDQGLGRSVELAPAGRLVLQAATQVMDEAEERMLAGIAVHDRDQLVMLLRRCVENLETTPPRHPPEQPNPSRAAGEPGVDNNGLRMPNPRPAEKPSIS